MSAKSKCTQRNASWRAGAGFRAVMGALGGRGEKS